MALLAEILKALGIQEAEFDRAIADVEDRRSRFRRLMPPSLDDLQLLLKGHLLIEEQLQRIIETRVFVPEALGTRWTFSQRVRLAQAMIIPLPDFEWVWTAVDKLNNARNALVHKAEPGPLDGLLRDFHATCEPHRATVDGSVLLRDLLPVWYNLDTLVNVSRLVTLKERRGAVVGSAKSA